MTVIYLVMTAVSGESRWTHWLVQSEWCARHSRVNVQLPVHAHNTMPQTINNETGNLVTTYLILIVLLVSLWILYAGLL